MLKLLAEAQSIIAQVTRSEKAEECTQDLIIKLMQFRDNELLDPVSHGRKKDEETPCEKNIEPAESFTSKVSFFSALLYLRMRCTIVSEIFCLQLKTTGFFCSPELETSSSSRRASARVQQASFRRLANDLTWMSIHQHRMVCSASASYDYSAAH